MRVAGHHLADGRVRLFLAELCAGGIVFLTLLVGAGHSGAGTVVRAVTTVLALQASVYLADLYDPVHRASHVRWLLSSGLGTLVAGLGWGLAPIDGGGLLLLGTGLTLPAFVGLRTVRLTRPRRTLVYGTGLSARRATSLLAEMSDTLRVVGYVPDGAELAEPAPYPLVFGFVGEVDAVARRTGADLIVVATDGDVPMDEALGRARADGVEVIGLAECCARRLRRVPPEVLRGHELAYGLGFYAPRTFDWFQRAVDVAAAGLLLMLSSPLLLTSMAAIRMESEGPIFYRQERVGRGGRTFLVTKLRTMRVDAERDGPVWAKAKDDRVTRVGRWLRKARVDELPQLWSVLAGDMSIVGPRPERPVFVEALKQAIPLYGLREAVKPGVTGWAQVCCPYGASVEDARLKLEFDLYFVRHRSPLLVASILFHTVRTVLTGKGAR
ncbi:MAG: hypothetical protein RL199_215 [Pseudomonadota bacterium]|jgi:exopolysaccharide biosynthesis polyprenyl glycosylphosphotransferase